MEHGVEELGLVRYDAMQYAIVAASSTDEVKQIRNQAAALEKYAKQARNFEAEKRLAGIRLHAELKGGEILKSIQKANGGQVAGRKSKLDGRRARPSNAPQTLASLGVTRDESSRWQKLADDPKAVRKYIATTEHVPTTQGALNAAGHPKQTEVIALPVSEEVIFLRASLADLLKSAIDPKKIAAACNAKYACAIAECLDELIPILTQLRRMLK